MPEVVSTPSGELTIASLPRRIAAALISTACVLAAGGLGALAGHWTGWLEATVKRASRWTSAVAGRSRLDWLSSRSGRFLQNACFTALGVFAPNLRLPGARMLGLRRVELATGGPVTVKQVLIHDLAERLQQQCLWRPIAPITRRETAKLAAMQSELKELHRRNPDERAYRDAAQELYRRHNVNPWLACAPWFATILIGQLPVLLSPRHQSLPDRVAGIVVVVGASVPRVQRLHRRAG